MRLFITSMQASDACDYGGNFLISERWPASGAVPAEKQLHHHRCVHAVPEQVPVKDAIVLLRSPAGTPWQTSRRQ
jgi:hypothetical protein